MNIINGYIEVASIADGGKDEFNQPLPAIVTWSRPMHCHIQSVTGRNDVPVVDGTASQASYKIFIDYRFFGNVHFNPDILRINLDGEDKGEYQVQAYTYKKLGGRTEIYVGVRSNKQL